MTYSHAPAQEPLPRDHEIYKFGSPILGHNHYILSFSEPCPREEKNIS